MARKISGSIVFALVVFHLTCVWGMNVSQYFNVSTANVQWGHRGNLKSRLMEYLKADTIHMIEADVRYVDSVKPPQTLSGLIMSHDNNETADMTLETFLTTFKTETANKKKGLKLDFKQSEAINHFKDNQTLKKICQEWGERPFYLNADIVQGPGGKAAEDNMTTSLKQLYNELQASCKPMMSIGWTTKPTKVLSTEKEGYTIQQIDNMKKHISEWKEITITFAMRASSLAKTTNETVQKLKELVHESSDKRSVTLWNFLDDEVDDVKLKAVLKEINATDVFMDLPENMRKKLIANGASIQSISTLMVLGSLLLSALFSKIL